MKKYLKFVGFLGVINAVIGLIAFIVFCFQTKQNVFISIFGVLTIALIGPAIGLALITLSDLIEDKEKIEMALIEELDEDKNKDVQKIEFQLSSYDNTYSVKKAPLDAVYLTIPSTFNKKAVTKILNCAFANCMSLKNVRIPDSITSIGKGAFENCRSLITITIPNSVTSIGEAAFKNCSSLTTVCYKGTEEQWNSITIEVDNENLIDATIHFNYE